MSSSIWKVFRELTPAALIRSPEPALLGRWCHPLSHRHCDQARKADLANQDNSMIGPERPSTGEHNSVRNPARDPVTVFVYNYD